jgi:hypothetical protein
VSNSQLFASSAFINIFQSFMLDACVDLHQFRVIVDQIQNFLPREVIASIEMSIDLAHEFKVFGRIHRPAVIAEVGRVMEQGDAVSARGDAVSSLRLILFNSTPS